MNDYYEGKIACPKCNDKASYYKKPLISGKIVRIIQCSNCDYYKQEKEVG